MEDLIRQAGIAPARAGHEFRHDRADQRQAAGDTQARKEVWQRARDTQIDQILQTRCPVDGEQVLVPRIDAAQSDCSVRDNGKNRDDGCANDQRALGVFDQDDDERRDRDDGRHLQNDGVREKAPLNDGTLDEQEGNCRADDDRQRQRDEGHPQRDPKRMQERRGIKNESLADQKR